MGFISKGQVKLFNTAVSKTGMTKLERKALLEGLGVASSKRLTQEKLTEAMEHFEKLGFVPKRKFNRPASSKDRLIGKITAIRNELGLMESYVDAMAQRMFKNKDGRPVASYRWLNANQLHSLVAALSYHQARVRQAKKKTSRC